MNGGPSQAMRVTARLVQESGDALGLAHATFSEPGAEDLMTTVGIIVPSSIYMLADRIRTGQQVSRRERDRDQAHRTAVKSAAKTAIMSCGADEETARKIVVAILANEIPNVTLRF